METMLSASIPGRGLLGGPVSGDQAGAHERQRTLNLFDVCRNSGGEMTLSSDQAQLFKVLLKEGATHVLRNVKQESGRFKNQCRAKTPSGEWLNFTIVTDRKI